MFFILAFLALICLAVSVWALSDIAATPESAFVGAGMSKIMWMVLIAVFVILFAPISLVLSVVYLSSVRPKLVKAA